MIHNCFANKVLHGLAFGSEMSGGIETVFVENFIMKEEKEYAIQFKSNLDRGGYIRNISIDGVFIDNAKTAIYFTNDYHSFRGGNSPSEFHNIAIENVICNNARGKAIDIIGLQERPIHHINLKNILVVEEGEVSQISITENSTFENIIIKGEDFKVKE